MTKYITYREMIDDKLEYFILQKEHPHFVGVISEVPVHKFVPAVPVSGYNLYLCFYGSIRGMIIPSYKNVAEEIGSVLCDMSLFFHEQRVLDNPKKYKKWKI